MVELKRVLMSLRVGSRSDPARRLASAEWYSTPGLIAPGNPTKNWTAPVLPSTADVAVQVSGSNVALTMMGTLLGSSEPQMFAAVWKTNRRCAPTVTPGFPPTG